MGVSEPLEPQGTPTPSQSGSAESGFVAGAMRAISRSLTRAVASIGKSSLAGTASGVVEMSVMFPLEMVKTRLQVGGAAAATTTATAASSSTSAKAHPSIVGTFKQIIQQEGVRGLFSGVAVPIMGSSVVNAVLFGAYEKVVSTLSASQPSAAATAPGPLIWFTAGLAGGFCSAFVTCPIDVVTLRMQVLGLGHGHGPGQEGLASGQPQKVTSFGMAKQIIATSPRGVLGLYRGIGPTLARETPGYGIFFLVYESLKKSLNETLFTSSSSPHSSPSSASAGGGGGGGGHGGGEHGGSFVSVVLAGGTAGSLSQVVVFPCDVIKARMQTNLKYTSGRACLRELLQQEGAMGLFRGVSAAAIHGFPAAAVGFSAYELTLKVLGGE